MKCPVCLEANLVMSERQGIEIDYCPQCRGVWLDRGELDKIIDRATVDPKITAPIPVPPTFPAVPQAPIQPLAQPPIQNRAPEVTIYNTQPAPRRDDYKRDYDDDDDDDYKRRGYRKKRGGFLGELFDFD